MFLCHDPETASAAARGLARTADRAGAGSCCDVICVEEKHRRHVGSQRLKRQQDKLRRPDLDGEAKEKPPVPDFSKATAAGGGTEICVFLERAEGLPQADFLGTADPYVEVLLMTCDPLKMELKKADIKNLQGPLLDKTLFKATSRIVRGSLTPEWHEAFYFSIPEGYEDSILYLRVLDYDLVISDDFLGHCSLGVLTALEWNRPLSAGWQALLRSCQRPEQRLKVLRDPRVAEAPVTMGELKLTPPMGQKSYDLSSAKVFIKVSLSSRSIRPLLQRTLGLEDEDEASVTRLLGEAAYQNDLWSVVALLSSNKTLVNALMPGPHEFQNHSPLLIACLQKHSDLAMALVDVFEASLVLQAPPEQRLSAAMCACVARDEGLAEWLISEGVPADLMDAAGRNVLFYAVKEALPQLTAFLLGQHRLSPSSLAFDGSSVLASAVASQLSASVVVAKQLLEAKASAETVDKKGNRPLHEACRAGNEQCIKLLLRHGKAKSLAALDSEGQLPSALARAAGVPEATLRLLEADAQPLGRDPESCRQLGESVEEAEKRELRARKAAVSAEADASWQAWRLQHPRNDADLERLGAGRDDVAFTVEELEDPYFSLMQTMPEVKASARRASEPKGSARKGWGVPSFSFPKGPKSFNFRTWMRRSARAQSYSPRAEKAE